LLDNFRSHNLPTCSFYYFTIEEINFTVEKKLALSKNSLVSIAVFTLTIDRIAVLKGKANIRYWSH